MRSDHASQSLGRFVADSVWESLDGRLRHEGKRAILNFVGCALGSAGDAAVDAAVFVLQPFTGPERFTLIGRSERLDAMGASFVNAVSANLLDYDDTHPSTIIHPAAPVAPVVFALAEQYSLSGKAALHAFILGVEVECRMGCAVSPHHYARGWHITSTCGVFGAAAACSKLLGLSAEQTSAALAIAASQSAGIIENLTSPAKNVSVGNAARNGLFAALLAREGYFGGPEAIEGRLGWARAMGDTPQMDKLVGNLGERWEFRSNTYKPYPSGVVFHAVIDACLMLRECLRVQTRDIVAVRVCGDQLLLDRGDREIQNVRDARVSIHHSAAIALARGRASVEDFEQTAVEDPEIHELRNKITAECDPAMPTGAARVTVTLRDGRTETVRVDNARGSPARPLSDHELEDKFKSNAEAGGYGLQARDALYSIWSLDDLATLVPLLKLLSR